MKYSRHQFLMGTDITIDIISNHNPLEDIYNSFWFFYSLEQEFSRFLDTSDLSILNVKKEQEVSNRFIEVFLLSKQIYTVTNWFFNPLINLNILWYSEDFWKWFFNKKWEKHNIDIENISIIWNFMTLKENQNLDLWGIVKWYAVDMVTKYLKKKGYTDFIINAGWDIFLSWKNSSGKTPIVAIDSPFNKKNIFATLEIENKAISTSWTYKRKWNIDNENFHHIITPETNTNNNEIISISLISDSCYVSDSYATACIAMGIEKSLLFLEKEQIDGIIIGSDGNIYQTKWMSTYNLEII